MNAKIVLTLALALPLSAQAEAPTPDLDAVHAIAPKSLVKGCYHNAFDFLDRREVAKGLGHAWSGGMNQLRHANRQAAQLCSEGWPAVKFTFVRGKKPADMAIVTGNARELAAMP